MSNQIHIRLIKKKDEWYKVILDEEDCAFFDQFKWRLHPNLYVMRHTNEKKGVSLYLSRELLNCPKGLEVDHRNLNKLDYRRSNLRICSHADNAKNKQSNKNTSSKYVGVSWNKSKNKWDSAIKVKGKKIFLGRYDSEEQAAKIRDKASLKYFADFAHLNFN